MIAQHSVQAHVANRESFSGKAAVRTALRWFAKHSTAIASVSILVYTFSYWSFAMWVPTANELDALLFGWPFLATGFAASVIVALRNIYELMDPEKR